MKISVFLNADVSNTNANFYIMIENRYIYISQVQISAFYEEISQFKYIYLHFN